MNRKVTYLKVHGLKALFEGLGNIIGDELPPRNRHIELDMREGLTGVEVRLQTSMTIQIIPYANIQKYDAVENEVQPGSLIATTRLKVANA